MNLEQEEEEKIAQDFDDLDDEKNERNRQLTGDRRFLTAPPPNPMEEREIDGRCGRVGATGKGIDRRST